MSFRTNLALSATAAWLLSLSICIAQDTPPADEPVEKPDPAVTLHVGDSAPALKPGKWLKGEPVTTFEKDKVYIVEFWATWCGPCKASIPHLTELQKKYPKVTFIGQDCLEQDPEGVAEFVKKMGDKMDYRVALDDTSTEKKGDEKKEDDKKGAVEESGKMAKSWLMAAGQAGIPSAFVVDGASKIAWIGHPMELEEVLPAIIAGTFDAKKFAAEQAKKQAELKKLVALLQGKNFDDAIVMIDRMVKENPTKSASLVGLKFQLLMEKKDFTAAAAMAPTLLETFKNEPEQLNAVAWSIVGPDSKIEKPDLDLAEKFASAAAEATQNKDGGILDTLARVYFLRGNLDKAIELQTKAVELVAEEQRGDVKKTLDDYKAAKEKKAEK
jgi:thiol-disulfide isomerase/thioredoxin